MQPSPPTDPTPTASPPPRRWTAKWYYFVIAGLVGFCLLCSCAGGAYLLFSDDRSGPGGLPGLGLASDPNADACELAVRGAPKGDTPADYHQWADRLREAAAEADHSDIRTAIVALAAALDRFSDVKEDLEAKKKAGTQDMGDGLAISKALRERVSSQTRVYTVCKQAGY